MDARRVAYPVTDAQGQSVCLDGKAGKVYYNVAALTFSPDGTRLAYWATTLTNVMVVVDGHEQRPFARGAELLLFSPDSRRLAYVGGVGGERGAVVVDDQVSPAYDGIGSVTFSPNSRRFGYFAESQTGTNLVVLDGKEIAVPDRPLEDSLRFSPDGRRVAYSYGLRQSRVVLDGQEGPAFDGLHDCFFSPDSQRFAYFAKRGKQWMVVLDGKEVATTGEGRWEGTTVFSSDSRRFATGVGPRGNCSLWVDGREQGAYDEIGEGSVLFSPDSKRLAYGAVRDGHSLPVVDGKEGKAYKAAHGLVFSPDSKRLAYWAELYGKRFVVLDDKEGQPYRNIALVTFSPDSRHLAYVAQREDGSSVPVVDGKAGPPFDTIFRMVFDGSSSLRLLVKRYHATHQQEIVQVNVDIAEE